MNSTNLNTYLSIFLITGLWEHDLSFPAYILYYELRHYESYLAPRVAAVQSERRPMGGGHLAPPPTPAAVAAILADRPAVAAAAAAAAAAQQRTNSTEYNPNQFDSMPRLALPQTPLSQGIRDKRTIN